MLRSKCASASKIAIVIVLIFAATIATSQGSGTSPGIDLINFNNLSLMEYKEPIMYDIGNGSHCNISTGFKDNCFGEITRSLNGAKGKDGRALQLVYGFSKCNNSYVQVVFTFNPPQDFSAYDHLVIDWRGDQTANTLEVGMTNGESRHTSYSHVTQKSWWGPLVVPFRQIGSDLDLTKVNTIFLSVTNITKNKDMGGIGNITIDNLRLLNISARKNPLDFENVTPDLNASRAAAKWLASQQKDTGLLQSWMEENNSAHLYDQSLALIVFSQEGMWGPANRLAESLIKLQNKTDGSWYETYNCSSNSSDTNVLSSKKWLGAIAWTVFALDQYLALGGNLSEANDSMELGADWLEQQISQRNDCLNEEPVEGAMDAWWALRAAGRTVMADKIKECLTESYWDEEMGRFKAGKDDWKPVSDVQTWGAAILRATGEKEKALRALSYAREALLVTSRDQKITALGDKAGPWSVSNECTGQYVVARGEGSNEFLQELVSQQRDDGAMPGSPDNFDGDAWNTQWHGVAPTAWLFFASSKGPFDFDIAE